MKPFPSRAIFNNSVTSLSTTPQYFSEPNDFDLKGKAQSIIWVLEKADAAGKIPLTTNFIGTFDGDRTTVTSAHFFASSDGYVGVAADNPNNAVVVSPI